MPEFHRDCGSLNNSLLMVLPTMYTLPLDPDLPEGFHHTANEARSRDEIIIWWDVPYAVSRADGRYDVLCLDGGAWDCPTFYGVAGTLEEAAVLAENKLTEWQAIRAHPSISIEEDGGVSVVRMPQSPLDDVALLSAFDSIEKANQYIARLDQPR